ncbi:glucose-6-phosphate 1-epimerase [Canna indica]|uniref:glucose-6-phosphate 1-epimerase n=1 Tax=Canna indica TaxID=4628 RepID=A0AAQ3K3V5_9LILI|nr:glucose-6-phosphate 1-epimerase [Canna indica]
MPCEKLALELSSSLMIGLPPRLGSELGAVPPFPGQWRCRVPIAMCNSWGSLMPPLCAELTFSEVGNIVEVGLLDFLSFILVVSFGLLIMAHLAALRDRRSEFEVTKDCNGMDHVVLRVPRGASARVRCHLVMFMIFLWLPTYVHSTSQYLVQLELGNSFGDSISAPRLKGMFISDTILEIMACSCQHISTNTEWSLAMDDGNQSEQKDMAMFKPPKAMRGGIPICFPQFGNRGSLEQHGFARNKMWTIDDNPPPLNVDYCKEKVSVNLLLKPSEEDLKSWPHCFEIRHKVCLAMDGDLTLISRVRNINGRPFSFSFGYHTYLSISDISEVRIEGLETLDYLDNLCQRERFTEQGDAVTFESEVDRIYLGSPNVIAVLDHEKKRTFLIRKEGLPDVVVWNPWERKAKSMVDLGDEEYKQMICVDAAVIEKPVTLKPGEEWTGRLDLSAVPYTYCIDHVDHLRGM